MIQAKAGGELGINGEWYEGGQFLPNYETTVKGMIKVTILKGTKKEIAPYVWEASPADDMLSIYDRINHTAFDNRRECEFVKGQGFTGFKFTECDKTYFPSVGCKFDKYGNAIPQPRSQKWIDWVEGLIVRFNNGERWFPLSEDPFHYKNQEVK